MLCTTAVEGGIALSVVRGDVEHDAFDFRYSVVARAARVISAVRLWNRNSTAVRIRSNLGGIEAHSSRGIERPLDPIAVQLAGPYARHEHMPIVVGPLYRWIEAAA